jgi:hypothetical protein
LHERKKSHVFFVFRLLDSLNVATFFLRVYPIGLALPSGFVPRVLFVRYVINFYFSFQSRPNVLLRDIRLREGLYSERAFEFYLVSYHLHLLGFTSITCKSQ